MTLALVTGAGGFIGTHLLVALRKAGLGVVGASRRPSQPSHGLNALGLTSDPGVELESMGALDAAWFAARRPNVVYHLAGMSQIGEAGSTPKEAFEANAGALWLLLEAIAVSGISPSIIVVSTDAVYGEAPGRASIEDDLPRPRSPYEFSKLAGEQVAGAYAQTSGLPIAVARLGNVYGPVDPKKTRIVPSLVNAVNRGEAPRLRGDGAAVRALMHVEDCVSGLMALASATSRPEIRGRPLNISGSRPISMRELAELTLALAGRSNVDPVFDRSASGETSIRYSSSERAETLLGWKETVRLEDGLLDIMRQETP